jgi:hypothetical protein
MSGNHNQYQHEQEAPTYVDILERELAQYKALHAAQTEYIKTLQEQNLALLRKE